VAALAGVVAPSAHGDILVGYQDVGSDLRFDWSGSLNLAGPGSFGSTLARIGAGASIPSSAYQYFMASLGLTERTGVVRCRCGRAWLRGRKRPF